MPDECWLTTAARQALAAIEAGAATHQGMALMLWSLSTIQHRRWQAAVAAGDGVGPAAGSSELRAVGESTWHSGLDASLDRDEDPSLDPDPFSYTQCFTPGIRHCRSYLPA
jgi:hypothetical protein